MLQAPAPSAVDLTGIEQLRLSAARGDPTALKEAATQFDALFIGMMLKSAREASLGRGIFDNQTTQQYLELMDDQVALELARKGGLGFGKLLLDQLTPHGAAAPRAPASAGSAVTPEALAPSAIFEADDFSEPVSEVELELGPTGAVEPLAADDEAAWAAAEGPAGEDAAERFVRRFGADATAAARALGLEPRLLLAQAALETGWGSATPRHPDGRPANNLFGIKAGADWRGELDDGARGRRRGAQARAVSRLRPPRRQLLRLRRLDRGLAALRGRARALGRRRGVCACRHRGRLRDGSGLCRQVAVDLSRRAAWRRAARAQARRSRADTVNGVTLRSHAATALARD
jgi:flagellar protein FlgJ